MCCQVCVWTTRAHIQRFTLLECVYVYLEFNVEKKKLKFNFEEL